MCFFNIESLYTNIPVLKTVDIILNRVFSKDVLYTLTVLIESNLDQF